jgi:hypothetical protein
LLSHSSQPAGSQVDGAEDTQEALAAFREKRKPVFKGR